MGHKYLRTNASLVLLLFCFPILLLAIMESRLYADPDQNGSSLLKREADMHARTRAHMTAQTWARSPTLTATIKNPCVGKLRGPDPFQIRRAVTNSTRFWSCEASISVLRWIHTTPHTAELLRVTETDLASKQETGQAMKKSCKGLSNG